MLAWRHRILAVLLLAPAGGAYGADAWPVKPLRFIVPQAPGAQNDVQARMIAPRLAEVLKQPVVVDNRPGAGGALGFELAAQAPNDGYTLALGSISTLAVIPMMPVKPRYDALRDFQPVTLISTSPYVLVVHPTLPARSVAEFVALAKSRRDALAYASSGTATGVHLTTELFALAAGVRLLHVPYKGAAPATVDLLAGQVVAMFNNVIPAVPHVKSGRLRALAVTASRRSAAFPDAPTIAESGYPGFESGSWQGVVTRAGASAAVVSRLHAEIVAILSSPEVREPIVAQGNTVVADTPPQFGAFIRAERTKWEKVIKAAGITGE